MRISGFFITIDEVSFADMQFLEDNNIEISKIDDINSTKIGKHKSKVTIAKNDPNNEPTLQELEKIVEILKSHNNSKN